MMFWIITLYLLLESWCRPSLIPEINAFLHLNNNVGRNPFIVRKPIHQQRHSKFDSTRHYYSAVNSDGTITKLQTTQIDDNETTPDRATAQQQEKPPSKAWLKRYGELKEFRDEYGHCNVARNYENLGNWVQKQRTAYKVYMANNNNNTDGSNEVFSSLSGQQNEQHQSSSQSTTNIRISRNISPLTSFQIQLLNDVHFIWDVNDWKYQLNLDKLDIYYKQNGHINIPKPSLSSASSSSTTTTTTTEMDDPKTFYNWLRRQRDEYKKYLNGKEHNLSNQRRQELEKRGFHIGMFDVIVGPDGKPTKITDNNNKIIRTFNRTSWQGRYEELVQFQNDFGHCNVPTTDVKYNQLSGWVQHQRAEKKKKMKGVKSRLSDEKEALLQDLGFVWNVQENTWLQRLNELKAFKEKHGHVRVHTKDGQLGNWIMIQRLQYGLYRKGKKNTLSNERMEALNELGFEWDIHEASWEDKFNELKECLDKCEDPNAGDSEIYPHHLISWIAAQRSEKRYKLQGLHSHLSDERETKLDDIGFDWKADKNRNKLRHEQWLKNFEKLTEYKKEHDTFRVPVKRQQTPEEKSFSHWVRDQRRYYKAYMQDLDAPITADRVALLDSIGFADDIVL